MKKSKRKIEEKIRAEKSNTLEGFISNNRVTRREFIQFAGAIGITAASANLFWSTNAMATPKRGGLLRAGLDGGASTDNFDPRKQIGPNHITTATSSMFDTLVRLDPSTRPIPGLAESWEVGKDGKTWRFKLRKGVEFHNGKT